MRIGGLQECSLMDYPGKIAAVVFTQGCVFRCGFCHNPELVHPGRFRTTITETDFFDFLRSRVGKLDGIVVTGGEPTIHRDIIPFVKEIKSLGFLVKLDTCGVRPDVVKNLIEQKLLDCIAMDIKGPLDRYGIIVSVKVNSDTLKETIVGIMNSGIDYEFRSTMVKGLHTLDDIGQMAQLIQGAKRYFLQTFVPRPMLVGKTSTSFDSFNKAEMQQFLTIAKTYVQECSIR